MNRVQFQFSDACFDLSYDWIHFKQLWSFSKVLRIVRQTDGCVITQDNLDDSMRLVRIDPDRTLQWVDLGEKDLIWTGWSSPSNKRHPNDFSYSLLGLRAGGAL